MSISDLIKAEEKKICVKNLEIPLDDELLNKIKKIVYEKVEDIIKTKDKLEELLSGIVLNLRWNNNIKKMIKDMVKESVEEMLDTWGDYTLKITKRTEEK